jgi:hypothetical protein
VLGQGVELAAGVFGVGSCGDDLGFSEGDEVFQCGIEPTLDVPGAARGGVRVTVAEEFEEATPHRICQEGKDEIPRLCAGIVGVGGGTAAVGHELGFTKREAPKARLEIRAEI